MESRYIHKSHNVSVLLYHLVCSAKYRRVVMSSKVDEVLREACVEIQKRWELVFLEIGLDRDHAHFLIQSVPTYSPTRVVTTVKSVIAREATVSGKNGSHSSGSCTTRRAGDRWRRLHFFRS